MLKIKEAPKLCITGHLWRETTETHGSHHKEPVRRQPFSCHDISCYIRARFLSLAQIKLRLCSANHRAGYFSNLACDWLSIVWAYSEQETENGPWAVTVVDVGEWISNKVLGVYILPLSLRINFRIFLPSYKHFVVWIWISISAFARRNDICNALCWQGSREIRYALSTIKCFDWCKLAIMIWFIFQFSIYLTIPILIKWLIKFCVEFSWIQK